MAALNEVAKEFSDEIRDGIAWVIIWKTGRSWNGYAAWLDPDTETFEPDDLEKAHEVLEEDPNAVMLNGYYCGHFGEDMNALEIAAGIRWHYENGYNLLSDSTAIPDKPETEPAEPEETMELTLTIGPDQAKAIAQEVVKTVQPAIDYAAKKGAGVYRLGCSGSRGVCENRGRVAEQIHGRHALLSKHPPKMVAPI